MKISHILSCVLLASIFLTAGCTKDDNPVNQNDSSSVLMPLNVGNQWTYQNTMVDSSGVVRFSSTIIYKIFRDTLIQNEKWYLYGTNTTPSAWMANRADGLWIMPAPGNISQSRVWYKYPANVNDSWIVFNAAVTLAAANISLTVPLGTFSCLQYTVSDTSSGAGLETIYFAPGKGIIKFEYSSIILSPELIPAVNKKELKGVILK